MILKNSSGFRINLTTTMPADGLVPLNTIVFSRVRGRRLGLIIGYNADTNGWYPAWRYPYVILWEDGYFEVYTPSQFEVIA